MVKEIVEKLKIKLAEEKKIVESLMVYDDIQERVETLNRLDSAIWALERYEKETTEYEDRMSGLIKFVDTEYVVD